METVELKDGRTVYIEQTQGHNFKTVEQEFIRLVVHADEKNETITKDTLWGFLNSAKKNIAEEEQWLVKWNRVESGLVVRFI